MKLSQKDKEEIFNLISIDKWTHEKVAAKFGVSRSHITTVFGKIRRERQAANSGLSPMPVLNVPKFNPYTGKLLIRFNPYTGEQLALFDPYTGKQVVSGLKTIF